MAGAPAGGERRAAVNFVSAQFALFLAGIYAAYWLSPPGDGRKYLLLAASYLFYAAWDWRFCGLLAFVTVNAHLAGSALARRPEPVRSRLLCFSLAADLAVLGWFKYAGFLAAGAVSGLAALGIESGSGCPRSSCRSGSASTPSTP